MSEHSSFCISVDDHGCGENDPPSENDSLPMQNVLPDNDDGEENAALSSSPDDSAEVDDESLSHASSSLTSILSSHGSQSNYTCNSNMDEWKHDYTRLVEMAENMASVASLDDMLRSSAVLSRSNIISDNIQGNNSTSSTCENNVMENDDENAISCAVSSKSNTSNSLNSEKSPRGPELNCDNHLQGWKQDYDKLSEMAEALQSSSSMDEIFDDDLSADHSASTVERGNRSQRQIRQPQTAEPSSDSSDDSLLHAVVRNQPYSVVNITSEYTRISRVGGGNRGTISSGLRAIPLQSESPAINPGRHLDGVISSDDENDQTSERPALVRHISFLPPVNSTIDVWAGLEHMDEARRGADMDFVDPETILVEAEAIDIYEGEVLYDAEVRLPLPFWKSKVVATISCSSIAIVVLITAITYFLVLLPPKVIYLDPPTLSPTPDCFDVQWVDSDGYGCSWYAQALPDDEEYVGKSRCSEFGNDYESNGYNANQACCVCGGGIAISPSQAPTIFRCRICQ